MWSHDGSLCIYRETTGVRVFDMETYCRSLPFTRRKAMRFALDLPRVVAVSVSPRIKW